MLRILNSHIIYHLYPSKLEKQKEPVVKESIYRPLVKNAKFSQFCLVPHSLLKIDKKFVLTFEVANLKIKITFVVVISVANLVSTFLDFAEEK